MSESRFSGEIREHEPAERLETYLIFVRHGKAEKLSGADTDEAIDAKRSHTEEGATQVYEAGQRLAQELQIESDDIIFERSSHRLRARQTVAGVVKGFLDGQKTEGVPPSVIRTSVNPAREKFGFPKIS